MALETPTDFSTQRQRMLLDTLRALSRDQDPVRSVNQFARAMRRIAGDQALVSVSCRGLAPGEYRIMRLLHQEGVADMGLTDMMFGGADAPVHRGGFIGKLIASERFIVDREFSLPDDPVLGLQLSPYRLLVAFPTYDLGVATNWIIYLHTDADGFSDEQIENRILQANLLGGVTNSKRRARELEEANAWIHRELDEIAEIQTALLPAEMPRDSGMELAAYYAVFSRAGGDYYDVFPLPHTTPPGQRWGVFIADASGHGPSAAVLAAMVSALLHSYPRAPAGPGEVLEHLNAALLRRPIRHSFVTAFFAIVDPEQRSLRYACAGHPMPILRDVSGAVSSLRGLSGLPLGIIADTEYAEAAISVAPGQMLLMFTDGITEAMSPKRELFGDERLAQVLADGGDRPAQIVERVTSALAEHQQGAPQQDDQTMLAALFL